MRLTCMHLNLGHVCQTCCMVITPVQSNTAVLVTAIILHIRFITSLSAGTPVWNTEAGGNHDWVEIWDGGFWSFTGPTEYTEKVDCPSMTSLGGLLYSTHHHLQQIKSPGQPPAIRG